MLIGRPVSLEVCSHEGADLGVHGVEALAVDVAQVDAELHLPRDHVAAVGVDLHEADGAAAVRGVAVRDGDPPA
jgi:hypothetical protein